MVDYLMKDLPDDLHNRFKAKCAQEGWNMKYKIIDMIKEYLRGKKK